MTLTDAASLLREVLTLLADHFQVDLEAAFTEKLKKNEQKYPVDKFRNSNRKYNE